MESKNDNTKEGKEKQFNKFVNKGDYSLVLASTLNQMVNYIPLQIFKNAKKVYYITVSDSKFKNEKWDEYLKNSIDNYDSFEEIKIQQREALDYENWKDEFGKKIPKDQKIVWNVTGGQRPYIIAVTDYTKDNPDLNYTLYEEGNTGNLSLRNFSGTEIYTTDYAISDKKVLHIPKALSLMGFDVSSNENKVKVNNKKTLEDFEKNTEKQELYASILKQYEDNKEVRKAFYALNKKKGEITEFGYEVFSDKKSEIKAEFQNYINKKEDKEAPNPFGYILEEMASYKIYKVLSDLKENPVIDMYASLKSYKDVDYKKNAQIDEFDIVLLTKYGQIINFECKSGGMTGTQAKKTNYSTYSIAGVYGTPILISPLLKKQIVNWKDAGYKQSKEDKEEVPDSVFTAYRSAVRVNIEVWGIDEIEDKLNNLLKTSN